MSGPTDPTCQIDLQVLDSDDLQVVEEIKELIQDSLATNKETWLLHSLLDYYARTQSERCMEVLVNLGDHHVKHLYDKLQEHMKGNHRLSTFNLLAYLVRKQPPWIHKMVSHPLFSSILKCLKVDTDVPVLLGGVLFVTALLPLVPLGIGNHLNDIFDIFTRLASFNIRKPVGNIPDIYLLHLHVGVDCLFHRMYGMYPCHFLTYLRAYCTKKENVQVFEEVIRPMCDRVKMHPLLITMSRDKELTTDRWRKMDVHDIVEDCSRLSLDLTQYHHDIERKHLGPPTHSQLSKMIADTATPVLLDCGTHQASVKPQLTSRPADLTDSILQSVSHNTLYENFWSPSVLCGLATPPASESVTPAGSLMDVHGTASSSLPMTVSSTPGMFGTPVSTPLESPLLLDEGRSHIVSQAKPMIKKTPVSGMTKGFSFLDSPQSEPRVTAPSAVLQSPLKSGFTAEPPQHAYKTKAMRKLPLMDSADYDDIDSVLEETLHAKISSNGTVQSKITHSSGTVSKCQDAAFKTKQEENISRPAENEEENTQPEDESKEKAELVNEETETENADVMTSSTQTVMSVHSLHEVIESLDHLTSEDFVDKEVSDLTQEQDDSSSSNSESYDGFPTHLQGMADSEMTAESVAQFMKNVNRIRFNSMNAERTAVQDKVEKSLKNMRSRSCPQFEPEGDDVNGDDVDGGVDEMEKDTNDERKTFSFSLDTADKNNSNQEMSCTQSETVTTVQSTVTTTKVFYSRSTSMTYGQHSPDKVKPVHPLMPHEELFPYALPSAAYLDSYSSSKPASGDASDHLPEKGRGPAPAPVTFSPAQLLDRFLQLGEEVHSKELSKIPLSSQQSVSWTHFGGQPPADEVNILRGQILLLHSQLMFERHKRELHAKRNRRLLGKLVKATALEEQNAAMRDQLRLQENEINNFSVALRLEQEKSRRLKEETDNAKQTHKYQMQSYAEQVEMLQIAKKKLQSDLSSSHRQNDDFIRELQSVKAQLFNKEQELNNMHKQAGFAEDMKTQLDKTQKEVLLMGELIQRYQQKVTSLKHSHRSRPETQLMLETAKAELAVVKAQLEQKCFQTENLTARNTDVEEQLKEKEELIGQLKKTMEEMRNIHAYEVQLLNDKYKGQKKIQVRLQEHILDLKNRMGRSSSHGKESEHFASSNGAGSRKSSIDTTSSKDDLQKRSSKDSSPDKLLSVSDKYATPRCTPSPDVTHAIASAKSQSAFRSYRPQGGSTVQSPGAVVDAHKLQADELAQEAEFMSDSEPSQSSQVSSRMSDKET